MTRWNLANSKYQSRHGEADGHGMCAKKHSYIAFVSWLFAWTRAIRDVMFISAWRLHVICSADMGNARASVCGTADRQVFHAFLYIAID